MREKLLARFHRDGESLVLSMDFEPREFLLRHRADVFYPTEHYRNYPHVLVRLAAAEETEVREHREHAWRRA